MRGGDGDNRPAYIAVDVANQLMGRLRKRRDLGRYLKSEKAHRLLAGPAQHNAERSLGGNECIEQKLNGFRGGLHRSAGGGADLVSEAKAPNQACYHDRSQENARSYASRS